MTSGPQTHSLDTITTERLILRRPEPRDVPAAVAFFTSDRARFVGGPLEGGRAWRAFASIAGHWTLRGYGTFVAEHRESGAPIALAGPWHPGDWPEREIGWSLLSAEAEGQGYATEAAGAARAHVFEALGWETAVSYVDPANAASRAVAERLGAVLDPDAARPDPNDLVFRHARPGGRA